MSVRNHRIAAITFLVSGSLIVAAWGRSQANDPAPIRAVRDDLRGLWVAESVGSGITNTFTGADAARTRVEFDGKRVRFRGLIGEIDAEGTYFVDPSTSPPKVDFKLDEGWIIGVYGREGDVLTLNLVPLALPERLGVPTRYRAGSLRADKHHDRYVFRRATPRG